MTTQLAELAAAEFSPGVASVRERKPEISFADLVKEMVATDSKIAQRDALVAREGFAVFRRYE